MSEIISSVSTKEYLLATELPEATKSYAPVPHRAIIETTLEALDKAGLNVSTELYKAARKGNQGSGHYLIDNGDKEMQIKLGWVNSYDKSIPLGSALGASIIVCTNGLIKGDMGRFKRKHTGSVLEEFQEQIGLYISQAGEIFEGIAKDRERMKEIEITKKTMAELTGRLFIEEGIITATQIGILKNEIANPTYQYGSENNVWQFYNHVTHSLKESNVQMEWNQHANLHKFITNEYAPAFS